MHSALVAGRDRWFAPPATDLSRWPCTVDRRKADEVDDPLDGAGARVVQLLGSRTRRGEEPQHSAGLFAPLRSDHIQVRLTTRDLLLVGDVVPDQRIRISIRGPFPQAVRARSSSVDPLRRSPMQAGPSQCPGPTSTLGG